MSMKYFFVFLGNASELPVYSYSDLNEMSNAVYIPGFYSRFNKIQYVLFRLHTMNWIKKYIHLPFKSLWAKVILKKIPVNPQPGMSYIYVCQREWPDYEDELHLIDYIKKRNPEAKFVVFFEDLFKTYHKNDYGNPCLTIDFIREKYDLAISFDQGDCAKYGFKYHPLVFSSFREKLIDMPYSDVYFLGYAKDRLSDILLTFESLKKAGLKCDFHIAGVKPEDRVYDGEIDYEPKIKYMDNLQHVAHTKCIVEIMQKGGKGYSQRAFEAIGLGKMLLTNNETIKDAPFYNPSFIKSFADPTQISDETINAIKTSPVKVDYNFKDKVSPIELTQFIKSQLGL